MYDFDSVNFNFDSDLFGHPNSHFEQYDTDGDGIADLLFGDLDDDGYQETMVQVFDTNNSGQFDTGYVSQDTNGDGFQDVIAKLYDYDQDGNIDSMTIYVSTNHDGNFDIVTKEWDFTGDGNFDKMETYYDVTGSGEVDYHQVYDIDPTTGMLIPAAVSAEFDIGGTMYNELPSFEPNDDYPEGISGDPSESMTHWECQGDTQRCALYSQKFVIEELTGSDEIDIEQFADIAKENGWFTEEGGTSLLNMNNMLDYYGIDNEMTFHNSVDDIEECLNNGGKVIVSIDSNEIWYGEDNNVFSPESSSNHAVEVIGIDHTDPDHPMVILNDSGSPNGKGEMIPMDVFEGAWEDGDCQMIKCFPKEA